MLELPTQSDIGPMKPHASLSASTAISPPLVLVMSALDPTGADGITADAVTCAMLGCHALAAATALTVQDTASLEDIQTVPPESLDDQARCLLEDMPVQAIKVDGIYSTETASAVAQVAADYSQVPLILHLGAQALPSDDASDQDDAEDLLAATFELLVPQADVVVIEYTRLARWIADGHLRTDELPSPMHAFLTAGADWVLALGAPLRPGHSANILIGSNGATTQRPTHPGPDRSGPAGGVVSAALAAFIASGMSVPDATEHALGYADQAISQGFMAGMGRRIPQRSRPA